MNKLSVKVIEGFFPHEGPHFDEVCAVRFIRRFGAHMFIGAEMAPVIPKALKGSELENLMLGRVPVGQLHGMLDDKNPATGKRIEGTCCALKVAKLIGIDRMPELDKLFRAVNRVDDNANASDSDISKMMKNAINSFPESVHPAIFAWTEQGVDAIIDYLILAHKSEISGQKVICTDYIKPAAVLESMISCDEPYTTDQNIITKMKKVVFSSEKQVENCIELEFVSRAMKATGVSDTEATDWIYTALAKCIDQQRQYRLALKELEDKGTFFPVHPRFSGEKMSGVLIRSDNMQIAAASRSVHLKCAVCIVLKSNGHVAVIPNAFNNLDMGNVWALIRMEETPAEKRKDASLRDYREPGNHPCAPHWYMMTSGGAALNGTNFIKPIRLTELSASKLIGIVRIGFTKGAEERFYELKNAHERTQNRSLSDSESKRDNRSRNYDGKTAQEVPVVNGPTHIDNQSRLEIEKALDQK